MRLKSPALYLVFGMITASQSSCKPRGESDLASGREMDLVLESQHPIKIAEASGLSWADEKKSEFLIVGDGSFQLGVSKMIGRKPSGMVPINLSSKFKSLGRNANRSQWESVAADRDHFFLLFEGDEVGGKKYQSKIFVVQRQAPHDVVRQIELKIAERHAIFEDWYEGDTNSLGEGMVLLKGGRILIIKEKDPIALIEFAPVGQRSAKGFKPGDAIAANEKFELPDAANSTLNAVKVWPLDPDDIDLADDASELHVLPSGRLAMLSDKSRAVFRLQGTIEPTLKNFEIKQTFYLPKKVKKPEGLLVTEKGLVIIATDSGEEESQLSILSGLIED